MDIKEILAKIKANKKYSGIADEIVLEEIEKYKKKHREIERYKDERIVKDIRTELHKAHGSFQNKFKSKRVKYLIELEKNPSDRELIETLLATNQSTKERIDLYENLYEKIFSVTGKPKVIVDIGSGINGVSIPMMGLDNELTYYSYDINEEDSNFLNKFFEIENINGKSFIMNCSKIEELLKISNSDLVLMLKFIDTIEKSEKGHKLAEEIIQTMINKTKFIVASFATRTITGREMNFPHRGWIERMLERIGMKFCLIESSSELFYVISKDNNPKPKVARTGFVE